VKGSQEMKNKVKAESVTIDGKEYNLDDLTDNARSQLSNIQFVDNQIQQLNNEWAVADTARIGYSKALQAELKKLNNE
jgi:hypothetical protein